MRDVAEEYSRLKAMHGISLLLKEGGKPVVLLPAFKFTAVGRAETMDLLLVPFKHSGYVTRLFFEREIVGRGKNWSRHLVVDRNWWAPSWNNVPETLSWSAMLCAHLRAVE